MTLRFIQISQLAQVAWKGNRWVITGKPFAALTCRCRAMFTRSKLVVAWLAPQIQTVCGFQLPQLHARCYDETLTCPPSVHTGHRTATGDVINQLTSTGTSSKLDWQSAEHISVEFKFSFLKQIDPRAFNTDPGIDHRREGRIKLYLLHNLHVTCRGRYDGCYSSLCHRLINFFQIQCLRRAKQST